MFRNDESPKLPTIHEERSRTQSHKKTNTGNPIMKAGYNQTPYELNMSRSIGIDQPYMSTSPLAIGSEGLRISNLITNNFSQDYTEQYRVLERFKKEAEDRKKQKWLLSRAMGEQYRAQLASQNELSRIHLAKLKFQQQQRQQILMETNPYSPSTQNQYQLAMQTKQQVQGKSRGYNPKEQTVNVGKQRKRAKTQQSAESSLRIERGQYRMLLDVMSKQLLDQNRQLNMIKEMYGPRNINASRDIQAPNLRSFVDADQNGIDQLNQVIRSKQNHRNYKAGQIGSIELGLKSKGYTNVKGYNNNNKSYSNNKGIEQFKINGRQESRVIGRQKSIKSIDSNESGLVTGRMDTNYRMAKQKRRLDRLNKFSKMSNNQFM